MAELITPQLKDVVLRHFVENNQVNVTFQVWYGEPIQGIEFSTVEAFINQFQKLSLMSLVAPHAKGNYYLLNVEAHDFINRGGFYGQEILFQKSVEDLLVELKKVDSPLVDNKLDHMEKITTIIANITSFLAALRV